MPGICRTRAGPGRRGDSDFSLRCRAGACRRAVALTTSNEFGSLHRNGVPTSGSPTLDDRNARVPPIAVGGVVPVHFLEPISAAPGLSFLPVGAHVVSAGVSYRVWAPDHRELRVVTGAEGFETRYVPMERE